jgi:hypothetical protein
LKKIGEVGRKAAHNKVQQFHNQIVFEPIAINKLIVLEKKQAMESLIFLTEKQDGTIKAQACVNGSVQHAYVLKKEAISPTAATEAVLITGVLDAKQS